MAISHVDGVAAANISAINGIAKANISAINGITASFGGGGFDTDAQAFFTASGVSDGTQQSAVNQLVLDLKAASIWTKMVAIYPFVGGDATKHSYNLKDPGTFQITWNGTVTHNANGVTGNGSTGYGDTGLNDQTSLGLDDRHLSVYVRSQSTELSYDIGVFSSGTNLNHYIASRRSDGFRVQFSHSEINVSETDGRGFFLGTRRGATDVESYKNGSSVGTDTTSATRNHANRNFYICARNNSGTAASFSPKNYAFASIGSGLTDANASAFYTAVQAFQTTLSRNV